MFLTKAFFFRECQTERKKIKKEKEELLCAVPLFGWGTLTNHPPDPLPSFVFGNGRKKMEREMSNEK